MGVGVGSVAMCHGTWHSHSTPACTPANAPRRAPPPPPHPHPHPTVQAEKLNGRAAMLGYVLAYVVDSLTGAGIADQQNSFLGKLALHVCVFGVLLFRTSAASNTFKARAGAEGRGMAGVRRGGSRQALPMSARLSAPSSPSTPANGHHQPPRHRFPGPSGRGDVLRQAVVGRAGVGGQGPAVGN